MTKNAPSSAVDAAIGHGLRSTIHPLNREHFRRERRRQHAHNAIAILKIIGGGLVFMVCAYSLLVSACFIV